MVDFYLVDILNIFFNIALCPSSTLSFSIFFCFPLFLLFRNAFLHAMLLAISGTLPHEKVQSAWSGFQLPPGIDILCFQPHFSYFVFLAQWTCGLPVSVIHGGFLCLEYCSTVHLSNPSVCIRTELTFHLCRSPPHPTHGLLGWVQWLVYASLASGHTVLQLSSYHTVIIWV